MAAPSPDAFFAPSPSSRNEMALIYIAPPSSPAFSSSSSSPGTRSASRAFPGRGRRRRRRTRSGLRELGKKTRDGRGGAPRMGNPRGERARGGRRRDFWGFPGLHGTPWKKISPVAFAPPTPDDSASVGSWPPFSPPSRGRRRGRTVISSRPILDHPFPTEYTYIFK